MRDAVFGVCHMTDQRIVHPVRKNPYNTFRDLNMNREYRGGWFLRGS
jgi:hypothetical protein